MFNTRVNGTGPATAKLPQRKRDYKAAQKVSDIQNLLEVGQVEPALQFLKPRHISRLLSVPADTIRRLKYQIKHKDKPKVVT